MGNLEAHRTILVRVERSLSVYVVIAFVTGCAADDAPGSRFAGDDLRHWIGTVMRIPVAPETEIDDGRLLEISSHPEDVAYAIGNVRILKIRFDENNARARRYAAKS